MDRRPRDLWRGTGNDVNSITGTLGFNMAITEGVIVINMFIFTLFLVNMVSI